MIELQLLFISNTAIVYIYICVLGLQQWLYLTGLQQLRVSNNFTQSPFVYNKITITASL